MEKQTRLQVNNLEVRQNNEGMILEGYAATFDSPTVLYKVGDTEYKEVIERGAFDEMITKDCCLKYNHSDNVPILARTRGNSLELDVDSIGLRFKAKLFDTQVARDVYTLVKEGALDKCSFAFTIKSDRYDRNTNTRHIEKIDRLFDVAIVDVPAYESTSVQARSFFDLERERESMEIENGKLKLKIKLGLED